MHKKISGNPYNPFHPRFIKTNCPEVTGLEMVGTLIEEIYIILIISLISLICVAGN